jgi:hypothetical protein
MLHSQILQFIWHIFLYVMFILEKFVMDALFSDSSSWQTTYPGICNVTVLESDLCTHTVYETIVENWAGMYCNDIIAHMQRNSTYRRAHLHFYAFFCFMTGLLQKHQHACAGISEPVKSLWTGSHIRIFFACYIS